MVLNDDKEAVLQKLSHAATMLAGKINPDLYPAGGVQLVYARKGARDDTGIACILGGLSAENKGSDPVEVGFGDAGMAATVLLTVMKFDPRILCVAIISCTAAVVKTMDERSFEICSFDPGKEPPGIRTMDWGVAQCCRNGVPDAIYSRGSSDTPAIIRLFGEDPQEVANNVLMLSA
jgi:thiamine-phosphate diphosphorylase